MTRLFSRSVRARRRDVDDPFGKTRKRPELDVAVKLHDLDLLSFPSVVGLGDARVFCGNADGTAGPIMLGDALVRPLGLGHDEAACAEFEVHELDGAALRLRAGNPCPQMPQSAAPSSTNTGASEGRTMMYSTPGLRMMSWRPGSARPVVSRPHAARHAMESGLSEPLGTAMRSGRPPACCSVGGGGKRLIKVERETGGGAALAVGPDRVVVAPARTERCAERGGEGDEDDACVVVERAHDREVDEDAVGQALLVELLEGPFEVGEAVLAAERRNQIAHARDRLASAADVRERADGLREDGSHPRLLRARSCGARQA